MKSGLGDRNNVRVDRNNENTTKGLNEVRSWRPEQSEHDVLRHWTQHRLNEVRSWRPEQYEDRLLRSCSTMRVSMKSGLGDRNNHAELTPGSRPADQSQ